VVAVVAGIQTRLPRPPPGHQAVVNSVLCKKAPSDVAASNFLALVHVEQLEHKNKMFIVK
jgi:hypothetical protein